MIVLVSDRGTDAWRAAHRGHICASDAAAILARPGTKRQNELVRRLVLDFEGHGLHTDEHPEPWAERHEADLRAALAGYRHRTGRTVEEAGFVTHDRYTWCGCSPHGLIGSSGVLHFRIRHSLRSWHNRTDLSRAETARLQLTMFVCERPWCEVVDWWDGGGVVADRMRSRRLMFDHQWLLSGVFPRLIGLWDTVRAGLRARDSAQESSPSAAVQQGR